jgi:RNA polymerase sigma factor (sigma-70 family)
MSSFRRLDDLELSRLGDDELVEHALAAREAGDEEAAVAALRVFAFGMQDALLGFVRSRLDSHGDTVIEEVAERALEDTVRSIHTLRGRTAQEARAFAFKIARMRIADYHRSGRVRPASLDQLLGEEPGGAAGEPGVGDEADAIDTAIVLEQALGGLRPDHRAVVELFVLSGYSARETAEIVRSRFDGHSDDSMSEQNVHQIGSRFRKDLRSRLEADREEANL